MYVGVDIGGQADMKLIYGIRIAGMSLRTRKEDKRQDPEYLEFLEHLAKPIENLPIAEDQLERKEAERAGVKRLMVLMTWGSWTKLYFYTLMLKNKEGSMKSTPRSSDPQALSETTKEVKPVVKVKN
ncbi:hypothetical protein J5N97_009673 [Dioscorea zingiberensis]|uniref:Uncharacterized protein n=1 Tax=Dioscorea zingiberensis TaxID=325984 RepID=A0A9D5CXZ6_9LILI|nr:hypothetical protein J5N97_009673 [Dioscorea zingiberensis]